MSGLSELPATWRAHAEVLAKYEDSRGAAITRAHADELEAAIRSVEDEALTLSAAASESGMSASRLRHMIAEGRLQNAGRKGAPRIRRGDLPRKATRPAGAFNADETARRVLRRVG